MDLSPGPPPASAPTASRPASSAPTTGPAATGAGGSGRPSTTCRKASSRRRKPAPPASTTPACFSTGSRSGVRSRACAAAFLAASSRSAIPVAPDWEAASDAAFTTVRIVPSTGRITAL